MVTPYFSSKLSLISSYFLPIRLGILFFISVSSVDSSVVSSNSSGLDGEGHGSSAYDMALLAREALKNPDFCSICSQSTAKVFFGNPPYERWLKNTNKLLTMCEGIKGVKTGFTDDAGRCLVSACERNGISLICVTLNDKNDWNDHMNLYDYGFSVMNTKELCCDDIFMIPVVGGTEKTIAVKAYESISIGADEHSTSKISKKIVLPPFVYANVSINQKVGEIQWYYDNRLIESVDIKAMKNTVYKEEKKKTFTEKIKDFLFN